MEEGNNGSKNRVMVIIPIIIGLILVIAGVLISMNLSNSSSLSTAEISAATNEDTIDRILIEEDVTPGDVDNERLARILENNNLDYDYVDPEVLLKISEKYGLEYPVDSGNYPGGEEGRGEVDSTGRTIEGFDYDGTSGGNNSGSGTNTGGSTTTAGNQEITAELLIQIFVDAGLNKNATEKQMVDALAAEGISPDDVPEDVIVELEDYFGRELLTDGEFLSGGDGIVDVDPSTIPRRSCDEVYVRMYYPSYLPNATETRWSGQIDSEYVYETTKGITHYYPACLVKGTDQLAGPWQVRIYDGPVPADPDDYISIKETAQGQLDKIITEPPAPGKYYTLACVEVGNIVVNSDGSLNRASSDLEVRQVCSPYKILAPVTETTDTPTTPNIDELPETGIADGNGKIVLGGLLSLVGVVMFLRYRKLHS